jgi:uncharacterized membrane protein YphA (DoxX/SURF4 family)
MIQSILQVVVLLLRAGLAAVLVAAGSAKLADLRSFALTLMGLGLPARWRLLLRGLALIIPLFEVGLGLAVVSGLWPLVINGVVLVLMASFSVVVIVALRRKLKVACRCFGTLSDSQLSSKGLARSLLLTGVAAIVFWSGNVLWPQVAGSPGMSILLVVGFLLFALAVAQAAQTIAVLKEGMPG